MISSDGGLPRRLTMEPSIDIRPSWSRDGRWIYFGSNRTGDWQIWKSPWEGGKAVQVTRQGGRIPFESADARFVYFSKYRVPGIWRLPVNGGDETLVLDQAWANLWGLTSQGICFFDLTNVASPALKFYSFAAHRTTVVHEFSRGTRIDDDSTALSVSPDGRSVLYTQIDQPESSNLILVENFR